KQEKRRQALIEHAETARISKRLVLLGDHAPVDLPLHPLCPPGGACLGGGEPHRLIAFSKAMEFNDLTRRASALLGIDPNTVTPDARFAAKGIGAPALEIVEAEAAPTPPMPPMPAITGELFPETLPRRKPGNDNFSFAPDALVTERRAEIAAAEVEHARYGTISDMPALDRWIAAAMREGVIALDLRTTSDDPMQADITGLAFAVRANESCYLPLGHRSADDLLAGGGLIGGQIRARDARARLKPLLEDPGILKIGHDFKSDALVLARHGITVQSIDDVMLMSYVLDAGLGGHGIDELATRHLDHAPIAFHDIAGKGRTAIAFERVEIARAATYCAESADIIFRLWRLFRARLVAEPISPVYATLERPLLPVLARMERRGIAIDPNMLRRLSSDFAQKTARLEDEIAELAGERINLGSPKQLGDILFGKMGLPGASKTPTGAWSTRANVLEELAEEQGIEIARK